MAEYMTLVNLDKKEIVRVMPFKFWEQIMNAVAPIVLYWLVTLPTPSGERGFGWGDIDKYKTLGRWAGDRIVVLGDRHPDYQKISKNPEYKDISIEVLEEVVDYLRREVAPSDLLQIAEDALETEKRLQR